MAEASSTVPDIDAKVVDPPEMKADTTIPPDSSDKQSTTSPASVSHISKSPSQEWVKVHQQLDDSAVTEDNFDATASDPNLADSKQFVQIRSNPEEKPIPDLAKSLESKLKGNDFFANASYGDAMDEYSQAIEYCPEMETKHLSVFYSNRAASHLQLQEFEEAITDCTAAIEANPEYIKPYWRRAQAYEKSEKFFEAQTDYKKILEIDPSHQLAAHHNQRLEPIVKEHFEQQKEEVVGKLKDFANWGLGKIGLSLENFDAQQDPSTGSYNIQFKPNNQ